jgi:hypothetical protein
MHLYINGCKQMTIQQLVGHINSKRRVELNITWI